MSGTAIFFAIVLALTWTFTLWAVHVFYREGWDHGYGAGYDDRDDETIYGEQPGHRRGRTTR